jgi:hypothetical protein
MKIDVAGARAHSGSRYLSRSTNPAGTRLGVGSGWPPALANSASICWSWARAPGPVNAIGTPTKTSFVYIVRGPVVLVTDAGEIVLDTGDCARFKAGEPDGHHLQNRGEAVGGRGAPVRKARTVRRRPSRWMATARRCQFGVEPEVRIQLPPPSSGESANFRFLSRRRRILLPNEAPWVRRRRRPQIAPQARIGGDSIQALRHRIDGSWIEATWHDQMRQ